MKTPLQVAIILIIIKGKGDPPLQREALFQKYWNTILEREKSKVTGSGIIRTPDNLLFGLHAYLGYLLHRNAAAENTRSLFPSDEFEKLVYDFLRSKDPFSPDEIIQEQVSLMIEDARTRLVLIVEPEKGFFGFELRSLQEFFAGVHLVQTANNTDQRFARLKAIAYSQHWRNVALFVSGRIVNNHEGEAANILEKVCRPIDRTASDKYLRRGAWLALDMAVDGVFSEERNLQYSSLEHALTVLPKGMTSQNLEYLNTALQKLPFKDRRHILSSLLQEKLTSVPLTWLPTVAGIYGRFVEPDKCLMRALNILLSSNRQELILEALDIGHRYNVEPLWQASQLMKHWHVWTGEEKLPYLQKWWFDDPQYTQKVLLALPLSKDQANVLMDSLLESRRFYYLSENSKNEFIDNPESLSEQIILLLQCISVQRYYSASNLSNHIKWEIDISLNVIQHDIDYVDKTIERFMGLIPLEILNQLINRLDLMPQLKAYLWSCYWQYHKPEDPEIEKFFEESKKWKDNQMLLKFLQFRISYYWPLFGLALRYQMQNEQNKAAFLLPYLSQETSIAQQVAKILQKNVSRLSTEDRLIVILGKMYTADIFPELVPIAEKLGLSIDELTTVYTIVTETGNGLKLSSTILQRLFAYYGKNLDIIQEPRLSVWVWEFARWELDHETAGQGVQLLSKMLRESLPLQVDVLITFFFKLLTFDATPLSLAPEILDRLVDEEEDPALIQSNDWLNVTSESLTSLVKFTEHENPKVQQGAITLWALLIRWVFSNPAVAKRSDRTNIANLTFDWQLCLSLIRSTNIGIRKKGILLLTCSDFPIAETNYCTELYYALAVAQDADEIRTWEIFLKNAFIRKFKRIAWQKFLETLLDSPQNYEFRIITAAMESYTELIGEASPEIQDKAFLGLP